MDIQELLKKHKATLYLAVGDSDYDTYYAHISFEDNEVKVSIFNEDGHYWDMVDEGLPVEWLKKITDLVDELKHVQLIPNYTLNFIKNDRNND